MINMIFDRIFVNCVTRFVDNQIFENFNYCGSLITGPVYGSRSTFCGL